mgnify:CR=1 FL=1
MILLVKKMNKIFILFLASSVLTGCIIHGYPEELSYYDGQQEYETSTENYSQAPSRTQQSFVTPRIDKKKKIKKYKKRKRVKARRYKRTKKRLRRYKKYKKVLPSEEQKKDKKKKRKKRKKSD